MYLYVQSDMLPPLIEVGLLAQGFYRTQYQRANRQCPCLLIYQVPSTI